MVTFSNLGAMGSLGNQLFQVAVTISAARKLQMPYLIPEWKEAKWFCGSFTMGNVPHNIPAFHQQGFNFSEINASTQDINLVGYFQSYKFFENIEQEIRDIFRFKQEIYDTIAEKYPGVIASPSVGVHVRRGDYLKFPHHHPVQSIEYYSEAASHFEDHNFFVTTDDPEWCLANLPFEFTLSNLESGYDMCLLSMCSSNIIANSSFSWWGAWLNSQAQKVIAPNTWFGPAYSSYNLEDLRPKDWILI